MKLRFAGREAKASAAVASAAVENVGEMEVCESSSLTAVANRSLDMSRSLTEKIAADADDSDDDDNDVMTSVGRDKQVCKYRL